MSGGMVLTTGLQWAARPAGSAAWPPWLTIALGRPHMLRWPLLQQTVISGDLIYFKVPSEPAQKNWGFTICFLSHLLLSPLCRFADNLRCSVEKKKQEENRGRWKYKANQHYPAHLSRFDFIMDSEFVVSIWKMCCVSFLDLKCLRSIFV